MENVYFAETPYGTQVRLLPQRRASATPGELAQRERIRWIGAVWRALDRGAALAWRAYAELGRGATAVGRATAVSGYSALATALLRLAPEGPLPVLSPSGPFFGNAAGLMVEGGATVTFRASQANATGVATELLVQPLASGARTRRPRGYVSAGFVGFVEGMLEATVETPRVWVACAYRFVRVGTGQETDLAPCGVVQA